MNTEQFGFRKGFLRTNKCTDWLNGTGKMSNEFTAAIFLHIEKAFDNV